MSKRKIFMAAGTAVLAIAAFMATQANKKFAGVTTAWYRTAGGAAVTLFHGIAAAASGLTTVATAGKTAFFRVGTGGTVRTVFTNSALTIKAYSKH